MFMICKKFSSKKHTKGENIKLFFIKIALVQFSSIDRFN